MCGIIGYTGPLEARKILLNGLSQLEYRGYDSAGIALAAADSGVRVIKTVGKVERLRERCKSETDVSPVSYTHLDVYKDVYKRQLPGFRIL